MTGEPDAKRRRTNKSSQQSNSTCQLSPPTPADLDAFRTWAFANGAVAPNIECRQTDYGGLGLFVDQSANQPIKPDTDVLSIPADMVLTHEYCNNSVVGQAIKKALNDPSIKQSIKHRVSARTVMYLCMSYERSMAQSADQSATPSKFHTYLKSLPVTFDTPLEWNQTTLQSIKGTNLYEAVPNKMKQLRTRYDNIAPVLINQPNSQFNNHNLSFELFLWASLAFSSRGFPAQLYQHINQTNIQSLNQSELQFHVSAGIPRSINQTKSPETEIGCMLPFLDLTNHRSKTSITWTSVPRGVSHAHDTIDQTNNQSNTHPGRIVFTINQSVQPGEELFNNYGAKSNEEFLFGYGFCLEGNAGDEFTVQVGGLDEQRTYIINQSIDQSINWKQRGFYLRLDSIPEDLYRIMRAAAMNQREMFMWSKQQSFMQTNDQSINQSANPLDWVSVRNEVASLCLLRDLLFSRLVRLSHDTIDQAIKAQTEDACNIESINQSKNQTADQRHLRLALIYRSGQRQILINSIQRVEQKLTETIKSSQKPQSNQTLKTTYSNDQTDQQLIDQYYQWLTANGVVGHSKQSIDQFDTLLSIPLDICMIPDESIFQLIDGLSINQSMSMFVLHELEKGDQSTYYPFLAASRKLIASSINQSISQSLQQSINQPNSLLIGLSEYELDLIDLHEQLLPSLDAINQSIIESDDDPDTDQSDNPFLSEETFTAENWLWANRLVEGRLFTVKQSVKQSNSQSVMFILPLVHFGQAQSCSNAVIEIDSSNNQSNVLIKSLTSMVPNTSNNQSNVTQSIDQTYIDRSVIDSEVLVMIARDEWLIGCSLTLDRDEIDQSNNQTVVQSDDRLQLIDGLFPRGLPQLMVSSTGVSPALFVYVGLATLNGDEFDELINQSIDHANNSITDPSFNPPNRTMGGSGQLDTDEELSDDERTENQSTDQSMDDDHVMNAQPSEADPLISINSMLNRLSGREVQIWSAVTDVLNNIVSKRSAELSAIKQSSTESTSQTDLFLTSVLADSLNTLSLAMEWTRTKETSMQK